MKYELKKSNINKPLGLFDHMFTDQGQLILKGAFISKYDVQQHYQPIDVDEKYHEWEFDLENRSITEYNQISQSEYEKKERLYIDFIRGYIKKEYGRSIEFFEERLDSCNDLSKQYFVLYTLKRKIKKFKDYVEVSESIPHRKEQLQWIEKIEVGIISKYEEYTGFLSEMRLEVKDVEKIVGKLIAELKLSEDPGDLDRIVYFICSNNMKENFGFINFGCISWTLKEIVRSFQSYGYLKFYDTEIVKTEFFRKKGKPISLESWQNSKSNNKNKKQEIVTSIKEAFNPK